MLDFLNSNSGALMVVFTAVVTRSTVFYALLTARLARETRLMRQAQTDPQIEAIIRSREEWANFVHLHIKNIGLGPAFDLQFKFQPDGNHEGANQLIEEFCSIGVFKNGAGYLGPSQEIVSNYSAMHENFDAKIEAAILLNVIYKSATGKMHKQSFRLDLSEFRGKSTLGKPHLYAIAQSLEKIQKDIKRIITGFKITKTYV